MEDRGIEDRGVRNYGVEDPGWRTVDRGWRTVDGGPWRIVDGGPWMHLIARDHSNFPGPFRRANSGVFLADHS